MSVKFYGIMAALAVGIIPLGYLADRNENGPDRIASDYRTAYVMSEMYTARPRCTLLRLADGTPCATDHKITRLALASVDARNAMARSDRDPKAAKSAVTYFLDLAEETSK